MSLADYYLMPLAGYYFPTPLAEYYHTRAYAPS